MGGPQAFLAIAQADFRCRAGRHPLLAGRNHPGTSFDQLPKQDSHSCELIFMSFNSQRNLEPCRSLAVWPSGPDRGSMARANRAMEIMGYRAGKAFANPSRSRIMLRWTRCRWV